MGIMKTLTINGTKYNLTPVVPASSVTLLASEWVGAGGVYYQAVNLPGVTENTKVDLQPTSEQLAEFHHKVLAFVAENEGGVVTVYAIGDKPMEDHTIQTTLTEVEGTGKIRGNTVGTTMPRPDWNQTDPGKADYIKNKEAVNNHLENEENPHGVTAEQIGAAPAGFGLGKDTVRNAGHLDANDTDGTGWYQAEYNTPDNTRWLIHTIHDTHDGEYDVHQIAYKDGIIAHRDGKDFSYTPWEYENPPMIHDVEYRTTERFNGKPVYVKHISYHAVGVTGRLEIDVGYDASEVVSITGTLNEGDYLYNISDNWLVENLRYYTKMGQIAADVKVSYAVYADISIVFKYTK